MATTGSNTVVLTLTVEQAEAIRNLQAFQKKMEASFQKQLVEAKKASVTMQKLFNFEVVTALANSFFKALQVGFRAVQFVVRALGLDIQEMFGRSAPRQVDNFKKALDGLEDQLIKSINRSGAFKEGIDTFTAAIKEFTRYLTDPAALEAINGFFKVILTSIADVIDGILGAKKAFTDLFSMTTERRKAVLLQQIGSGDTSQEMRLKLIQRLKEIEASERGPQRPDMPEDSGLGSLAERLRLLGSNKKGPGVVEATPIGKRASDKAPKRDAADEFGTGDERDKIQKDLRLLQNDMGLLFEENRQELSKEYRTLRAQVLAENNSLQTDFRNETGKNGETIKDLFSGGDGGLEGTLQAWRDFRSAVVDIGVGSMQDLFNGLGEAMAGSGSILDVFSGFIGGMIKSIGQLLIAMGTAGIAAAIFGSFFPGIGAAFGANPLGMPAALAALAIGTGLVALGSVIGGGGSEGEAPSAGAAGGGGGGGARDFGSGGPGGTGVSRGFDGTRGGSDTPSQVTFVINGGFFGSDKRAAGRYLADVLAASGALQPGGR